LAALGTGAGWLNHRLSLTSQDETVRTKAVEFISTMVKAAAPFHASVIIGSMQGRHEGNREQALDWLRHGLKEIGKVGLDHGVTVLYEPLNRYETNLINQISEAATFVKSINLPNVLILADLFHMNIEERSISEALLMAGKWLGHLHFVDSNRRPAGCGHMNFLPVFRALRQIQYDKFVSAEALPYPNPVSAARITMASFTQLVAGNCPKPVL
jgi:sugar phosphate isomerase/epimerase